MQKPTRTQSVVMMIDGSAHRGDESQATGPMPTNLSSALMTP